MIVYALGIHSGGGKVLLDHILTTQELGDISFLICDSRYKLPDKISPNCNVTRIPPSLISRWRAEFYLKKISELNSEEGILCFSNMPPAFKLNGKVILFFQNALLLPGLKSEFDSLKTRIRILYEKLWIYSFLKNVDEIWVQTRWMRTNFFHTQTPILVKPFLPNFPPVNFRIEKKFDFITVSGNARHKMLNELLFLWDKMPADGPNLLVVTEKPSLHISKIMKNLKNKNIHFVFDIPHDEVFIYYQQSYYLIVSSKVESFCLPIYEALHFGLKVIAIKSEFSLELTDVVKILSKFTVDEILNNYISK